MNAMQLINQVTDQVTAKRLSAARRLRDSDPIVRAYYEVLRALVLLEANRKLKTLGELAALRAWLG